MIMSSFTAKKLDQKQRLSHHEVMKRQKIAKTVRERIEAGGEQIWRLADFKNLPFTAVAKALSRLFRLGIIQRLGKGLYYKPRQTAFGPSKPNPNQLRSL